MVELKLNELNELLSSRESDKLSDDEKRKLEEQW